MATIYDAVGLVGVMNIVLAYFFLQIRRLEPEDFLYSFLNFVGASMILVSLFASWNLSAAIIEIFWILISLYGLYQYFSRKSKNT